MNVLSRRQFLRVGIASGLLSLGGFALGRATAKGEPKLYSGQLMGPSSRLGHLIRDGKIPAPRATKKAGVVIVGGGVAGLSAAWWLSKQGLTEFSLLELENHVGGNSRSGSNSISPYPWGAHYVPLPGPEAVYVHELFQELGVITGHDASGLPRYNEYYLCHDPAERLLINGVWQEGLVPQTGITAQDREQIESFLAFTDRLKQTKGRDGRSAFVIPIELSSRDESFRRYDRLTMAEFMSSMHWDSPALRWYVNYCCRDDYGAGIERVSAWAGLHYFAARTGRASNADPHTVLTWPNGNGWLVEQLRTRVASHILTQQMAVNIEPHRDRILLDVFDAASGDTIQYDARAVICATPRFVTARLVRPLREHPPAYLAKWSYAPWIVANVDLSEHPHGAGAPLSWDNVSYHSESLGYIVSTHQALAQYPKKTVLTYYLPLTDKEPVSARREAATKSHQDWAQLIAADLNAMHPGIDRLIERINVWIWGHGMICPTPGFIWGDERRQAIRSMGRIFFAHSDMSGMSMFEEAQYRGVEAAKGVMQRLSKT